MVAVGLYIIGYWPSANVRHIYLGKQVSTSWVWLDALAARSTAMTGGFSGTLYVPGPETLWLDNDPAAELTFKLNGQVIYHGNGATPITLGAQTVPASTFSLDYAISGELPARGHIGLMTEGLFGIRYPVPAWDYAPSSHSDLLANIARALAIPLGVFGVLLAIAALRLNRRAWLGLGLVVALTLGVRLISLSEKFSNDPTLWTMDTVWDNYAQMGQTWLAGTTSVGGNIYQQGTFVYLGMLQMALGPDLKNLYVLNTLLSGVSALAITLSGWALFDRPTGYAAGLITALFAPLIHYQQTLQDVPLVVVTVSLYMLMLAGLYRYRNVIFALGCGLVLGLGTDVRSTVLVLLLLPLLICIGMPITWRTRLGRAAVIFAGAGVCILPITLANFRVGAHGLTANLADYQLFRSNNLDSNGFNTFMTQSERLALARGNNWTTALERELARDPGHVLQLTIRRIGLFWDPLERSDSGMVDYQTTGLAVSPTLLALSLGQAVNFTVLMGAALFGLGVGLSQPNRRRAATLIGMALGLYIASLALFYVIGRVRVPITPIAALSTAIGVVGMWRLFIQPVSSRVRLLATFGLGLSTLFAIGLNAMAVSLPSPALVSPDQLPAGVVHSQATYNGEIRLLGYAFYDSNNQPNGYLTFELFWQALRKPSHDYVVSTRLVDDATGQITNVQNVVLGTIRPPALPSSQWVPGDIFNERYLLQLPAGNANAYDVLVGLYDRDAAQLLPVTDATAEVFDSSLRLTAVGMANNRIAALADGEKSVSTAVPGTIVWNQTLALDAGACFVNPSGITVTLDWSVLQRPIEKLTLFVHTFRAGKLIGQRDALPIAKLPTDAWLPGESIPVTWELPVVTAGIENAPITVRVGLYDFTSQRWNVSKAGISISNGELPLTCSNSIAF